MDRRSRLVYSSREGRTCPSCARPVSKCACRASPRAPAGDGVVRIRREVAGRRGRTVTTVSGIPLASDDLRRLAGELKRLCGTGGSVKSGVIEIQGDHRERIAQRLRDEGYTVKLAGG